MTTLTAEQILGLAPDASSAKSGKDLAATRKWVTLGSSDHALWGECQGSGAKPYQTQIDLSEPAFKCSCPSRKFPCKHGIGLYLLYDSNKAAFQQGERPVWVTAWLDSRAERVDQKQQKAEAKAAPDPAAQAKRQEQRERKVLSGIEELDLWLQDLVRHGLADAQSRKYGFWDGMAARLVDAQAPGLARMVGELGSIPSSGAGWQQRILESIGRLHLATQGYKRLDELSGNGRSDLRQLVGWTINQADLLEQPGISDDWLVVGVVVDEQERLKVQRTWLFGQRAARTALLLDFAHGSQRLEATLRTGTTFHGDIVYFPGSVPMRCVVKSRETRATYNTAICAGTTVASAVSAYCDALVTNPWLERGPMALSAVVPARDADCWVVHDDSGAIPLAPAYTEGWQLVSISGGSTMSLFGEWDGSYLLPLSASKDERLWAL